MRIGTKFKIFMVVIGLSIFSIFPSSVFMKSEERYTHYVNIKKSIQLFIKYPKKSIVALLFRVVKIFSNLKLWKQKFSVLQYFYEQHIIEKNVKLKKMNGKNGYYRYCKNRLCQRIFIVPENNVVSKNYLKNLQAFVGPFYNNNHDKLVLIFRLKTISSLYNHMLEIRSSKNTEFLLPILKFFSTARLSMKQTEYIYLDFLPTFFLNSSHDRGSLCGIIDYYKKRIKMRIQQRGGKKYFQEDFYDSFKKAFPSRIGVGFPLKILYHFYRYKPYIQRSLIKECFFVLDRLDVTYNYSCNCHYDREIFNYNGCICGAYRTTILIFLLLEMKQAIKKNNEESLIQLSLLFKFLVVQCNAHLFMHDDNHQVPIMMIEEDKELKQIIEKNFEQNGFQEIIKKQLSNNFCPDDDDITKCRVGYCTPPLFDAIAHYDVNCLRYIMNTNPVRSDAHSYYFRFYHTKKVRINDQIIQKNAMPLEIAFRFHGYAISHALLYEFPHQELTKITRKDADLSPYLPVLQMLLEEEKKGKDVGLKDIDISVIVNCFEHGPVFMDETYEIFAQIIESNKLSNHSISDIGFDEQKSMEIFDIIQSLKLCHDVIAIIMSYGNYHRYSYNSALSSSLTNLFGRQFERQRQGAVTSKKMINFKKSTPERNILTEYYVAMKKLEKKDNYLSDSGQMAKIGYYQLLTILGYDKDESGYSNIFDDHYALFLKTINTDKY